ncbi:hydroxymethylpyrimidine/phosphomethylpyrimidine kinase [Nocardioides luteus]|uniref:Hydroxymethylpyrimidine/phosphomethylpyrimidine kinase n=1 Tax=Nocardioides luteus TaxID=1844 RepID=A0ABQ5SVD5_9ACTN|nr:bifunctional hydroxymethylpyrimidine kinase/phosphomethylpyrimidine kinase [Nocardioides luteus]MDR7309404.1 hydroxymethylpyrimidine/phosphomethylpyrimidine kinase [Nocardioides luteus]GGR51055.1 hydroxymethylpyrimidine/phosphomethylpyrimidine kinase [Nocardioides luteus]GLJ67811.1 hydroxymethylpyrimidine/phosphomethylpyrimidine kinase [Nocardioides luteus]
MNPPVALTIAGTDSGGAAGTAADLATFAALGVHGACVITAVTAQDTTGVSDIHPVPLTAIEAQLDAVFDDLPVAAVKTGMLGTAAAVEAFAQRVVKLRVTHGPRSGSQPAIVVDPVLVATSGAVLGGEDVRRAYLDHLLPVATVLTPNLDEARALLGRDGTPSELAAELAAELAGRAAGAAGRRRVATKTVLSSATGGRVGLDTLAGARGSTSGDSGSTSGGPAVIVTGGDPEATGECTDWLAKPGETPVPLTHPAVATSNDHGTGCTYSSALAAHLAHGAPLREAAELAAAYVTRQLLVSSRWILGRGRGPIAHTSPTIEETA